MHGNICDTHYVHDVDKLKQRLRKVWRVPLDGVMDDTMDGWVAQTSLGHWVCIHAKEGIWAFNMIQEHTYDNV